MQKLIWAKTIVSGKTSRETPITRGKVDSIWNYYRDICVIAIPKNEAVLTKDKIIVITDGLDQSDKLKNALPQGKWDVLRFGHTTIGKINLTAPVSEIGRNLQVVPDWVINKTERPSKNRITFCTVDFFKKDTPLLPSGLIGPVKITIEDTWDIK
jgi:hypothetical protein